MLDAYALRARLFPAMLVSMPAVISALVWLPTIAVAPIAVTLFTWFGIGVLLAELARDMGKRREPKLWASWNGSPTVRRLRLREQAANAAARDRWRTLVAALVPDLPLPTLTDETADPRAADQRYDVFIARLRELTRNTSTFPLLFQENISYGFRRNLWAMKPAAIFIAMFAIAGALGALPAVREPQLPVIAVAVAIATLMLTWMLFRITANWVKEAAERYADQLLWTCEQLLPSTPPASPPKRVGF
jgi:hypothetical protein